VSVRLALAALFCIAFVAAGCGTGGVAKSGNAQSGKQLFTSKCAGCHTLGAAGALEAVVSALALRHQFVPAGVGTTQPDPVLQLDYVLASRDARVRTVLSNSFGFGGTNCSLILGRRNSVRGGSETS